jgi:hypothetical protein
MESKGNWVENLKSQVCVYPIERAVQEPRAKTQALIYFSQLIGRLLGEIDRLGEITHLVSKDSVVLPCCNVVVSAEQHISLPDMSSSSAGKNRPLLF